MYRYTIYNLDGNLLEQAEQEEPVDIEALCKKHDLGYWKHTHRIETFQLAIYWYYRGRIQIKHVKGEEQ